MGYFFSLEHQLDFDFPSKIDAILSIISVLFVEIFSFIIFNYFIKGATGDYFPSCFML